MTAGALTSLPHTLWLRASLDTATAIAREIDRFAFSGAASARCCTRTTLGNRSNLQEPELDRQARISCIVRSNARSRAFLTQHAGPPLGPGTTGTGGEAFREPRVCS